MDLNQLYHDHQIALMRACRAATSALRDDHVSHARDLGRRIHSTQTTLGAAAARWPLPAGCAA